MEMTAPVLVRIPEETKMWEPAVYTLSFLLPAAYQEKPALPTNEKVGAAPGGGAAFRLFISAVDPSGGLKRVFDVAVDSPLISRSAVFH